MPPQPCSATTAGCRARRRLGQVKKSRDPHRRTCRRIAIERIERHALGCHPRRRYRGGCHAFRFVARRRRASTRDRSHQGRRRERAQALRHHRDVRAPSRRNAPIACHAASFSSKGRVYAGDDDGSASVAYPASRHAGSDARRRLPIEADERHCRRGAAHARGLRGHGVADRAVEAPLPAARDDRVPQRDAARPQRGETPRIGQRRERHAGDRREQRPEVIARMRVVLLGCERRGPRKAAEDQHARVAAKHRRQSDERGMGQRSPDTRLRRCFPGHHHSVRGHAERRTAASSATPANTAKPSQWLCRNARKHAARSRRLMSVQ